MEKPTVRLLLTEDSPTTEPCLIFPVKGLSSYYQSLVKRTEPQLPVLNLPWDEPPVEVRLAAVKWMKDNNVGVEFLKVREVERVSLRCVSRLSVEITRESCPSQPLSRASHSTARPQHRLAAPNHDHSQTAACPLKF